MLKTRILQTFAAFGFILSREDILLILNILILVLGLVYDHYNKKKGP